MRELSLKNVGRGHGRFYEKTFCPEKDDKNILAQMFSENNDKDYICCKQKKCKQVMDGSNNNFSNTTMQTRYRKETILNKKSHKYRKNVVSSKHIYQNNETHA